MKQLNYWGLGIYSLILIFAVLFVTKSCNEKRINNYKEKIEISQDSIENLNEEIAFLYDDFKKTLDTLLSEKKEVIVKEVPVYRIDSFFITDTVKPDLPIPFNPDIETHRYTSSDTLDFDSLGFTIINDEYIIADNELFDVNREYINYRPKLELGAIKFVEKPVYIEDTRAKWYGGLGAVYDNNESYLDVNVNILFTKQNNAILLEKSATNLDRFGLKYLRKF